jgi:hypothetical protein
MAKGSISMQSLFCIFLIFLCIFFRGTVISGAAEGLSIWYQYVVPVLLPFMIISRYFVLSFHVKKNNQLLSSCSLLLIGILCGYPMGAKLAASLVEDGKLSKRNGQLLLPLCNNISPMFLAGYVHKQILQEQLSLFHLVLAIYLPYLLLTFSLFLLFQRPNFHFEKKELQFNEKNSVSPNQVLTDCIRQITIVGIYIMIFSILLEFMTEYFSGHPYVLLFSAQLEITGGIRLLPALPFSMATKTALIVASASFGGLSAIYQTKDALGQSGLSILLYIICKVLCAITSGILMWLLL